MNKTFKNFQLDVFDAQTDRALVEMAPNIIHPNAANDDYTVDWEDLNDMDNQDRSKARFYRELVDHVGSIFRGVGSVSASIAAIGVTYLLIEPLFALAPYILATLLGLKFMDSDGSGGLRSAWQSVKDLFTGRKTIKLPKDQKAFSDMARNYMKFVNSLPENQKNFVRFKLRKIQDGIKRRNAKEVGKHLRELDEFLESSLKGDGFDYGLIKLP